LKQKENIQMRLAVQVSLKLYEILDFLFYFYLSFQL